MGKHSQLSENGDIELRLGATVVAYLAQFLLALKNDHSKYNLEMDNFFTSPGLLRHIREKSIAATETARSCRMENSSFKSVDEIGKMERRSSDVAVQASSNIAPIRCIDYKVVNKDGSTVRYVQNLRTTYLTP